MIIARIDPVHLVKAGARRHINFATDDRFDARFFCRTVKLHRTVHHAVVSHRHRGLPQLFQPVKQPVDAAGTIQQAVFGMQMQVGKLSFFFTHCFDPHLFLQWPVPIPSVFSFGGKPRRG
ncbi:hypothetical protein SDC9_102454 [bioreactor metagenome]|uniref:Uncharacterized protein n=1 Tax=bioreactor metagenome TaxID=1076179 RepID=A0A645ARH3_9ZZZZ